jgi:septal ring factor EnvC (AmiA/AmiB activator)
MAAQEAHRIDLVSRLSSMSQELQSERAQATAIAERNARLEDEVARLGARFGDLEGVVQGSADALRAQSSEIDALRATAKRLEETTKQLRGDLARTERQATIDLDEMRRANMALAEAALFQTGRSRSHA